MKYLVTGKEMQLLDKNTSEHFGVPAAVLMEQAAMVFVRELLLSVPNLKNVLVVSGTGNNGADGIAIARLLNQKKIHTELYTMQNRMPGKKGSDLFELQLRIYRNYGYPELYAMDSAPQACLKSENKDLSGPELHAMDPASGTCQGYDSRAFSGYDCVIDALFGIGLSRDISGVYAETVAWINALGGTKAAVDIASGISGDNGAVLGCAVRCDHTITFSFGKTGMYLWPGSEYSGQIHVVPMGITEESLAQGETFHCFSPEQSDLLHLLPERRAHSNKGTYGRLLVIAGGLGMAGACAFSAKAAYRTGTGLVSVYTHEKNRGVIQTLIPEAVLHTWNEEIPGEERENQLKTLLRRSDAVVIGPGLSTSDEAKSMVNTVLRLADIPVIADADALNILAMQPDFLQERRKETALIITPHLAEMSRLTGHKVSDIQKSLLAEAQSFAAGHNCICVLKDFHTVTAAPDGRTWINLSGNDGMATGGSGDVLSGIIGGLLAQGCPPDTAAYLGVYLHGCAGDAAAAGKGHRSMIASDIIDGITIASRGI